MMIVLIALNLLFVDKIVLYIIRHAKIDAMMMSIVQVILAIVIVTILPLYTGIFKTVILPTFWIFSFLLVGHMVFTIIVITNQKQAPSDVITK